MTIYKLPKLADDWELLSYRLQENEVFVKYFPDGVQAGFPSPAEDYKEKRISLDAKYLSKPESTYLIKAKGYSMLSTIFPEDIIIVRSDLEVKDNEIGLFSVNNTDFTVKRLDKKNNVLLADNKDFKNIVIKEDDVILCLGRAMHIIRNL